MMVTQMKKIIKESNKKYLVVDYILYTIYIIIGFVLLRHPELEVLQPIKYITLLFYLLGFFSLISYFINRRKDNYEFLFLGLINILTGSFTLIYYHYPDKGFILGSCILIYSISSAINKGYHTIVLSRKDDTNMFSKAVTAIMLCLLGYLVISNFYNNTTMYTLVIGFYFLAFGIISIIELIINLVISNHEINKKLLKLINTEKKEVKKIKEVKTKNPNKNI